MRVSFYVSYPKEKNSGITCTVVHGSRRVRFGTGIVIATKNWSADEQRMKRNCSEEIQNANLDKIRGAVASLFEVALSIKHDDPLQYVFDNIFDQEVLARRSRPEAKAETKAHHPQEILVHYRAYIENVKSNYKTNSFKIHQTIFNHFVDFIAEYAKNRKQKRVLFSHINPQFYDAYIQYLFKDVGLTSNTVAMNVKKVFQPPI